MTPYYPIVDVEFHDLIEELDQTWGIWSCTVTLEDDTMIAGTIQGDGVTWSSESFESTDIGEE